MVIPETRRQVGVVVKELRSRYLTVHILVHLAHHVGEGLAHHLVLVVCAEALYGDLAVGRHLLPRLKDETVAVVTQLASDAADQLRERNAAVAILVEIIEEALELNGRQVVASLLEKPHALVAIKAVVPVRVKPLEHSGEVLNTVHTLASHNRSDLFKDLVRGFPRHGKLSLDIGVIARSLKSHKASELLIVNLARLVGIKLLEECLQLDISKVAAKNAQGISKLSKADCAVTAHIKVFEDLSHCLAFITGAVRALSDLLEHDVFQLADTSTRHVE